MNACYASLRLLMGILHCVDSSNNPTLKATKMVKNDNEVSYQTWNLGEDEESC